MKGVDLMSVTDIVLHKCRFCGGPAEAKPLWNDVTGKYFFIGCLDSECAITNESRLFANDISAVTEAAEQWNREN